MIPPWRNIMFAQGITHHVFRISLKGLYIDPDVFSEYQEVPRTSVLIFFSALGDEMLMLASKSANIFIHKKTCQYSIATMSTVLQQCNLIYC